MTFANRVRKASNDYQQMISGEKEVNIDWALMGVIAWVGFGLVASFIIQTKIAVDPFLLLGIIFGMLYLIGMFLTTYIRWGSIHIFAPNYSWSVIYTKLTYFQMIEKTDAGTETSDWAIIPLMGGLNKALPPLQGGGKWGFLVANKQLIRDFGGNIEVRSNIHEIRVGGLPAQLAKEVLHHERWKGDKKKVPIFWAVEPWESFPGEFDRELHQANMQSIGDFYQRYQSEVLLRRHAEDELAKALSREKNLSDIAGRWSGKTNPPLGPQYPNQ